MFPLSSLGGLSSIFGFTLPLDVASHCLFDQDRFPWILDALTLDRFEIHQNMRVPEEKRKKNVGVNGGLYFWLVSVLRVFFQLSAVSHS